MKINITAQQLSHSIASSIEAFTISGELPELLKTAEFVKLINNLFDSLNGWTKYAKKMANSIDAF